MDEEMIEYQELFAMLNGSNWIHFSEKPKMFFIDVHPMKTERTGMFQFSTIILDNYHDFVRLVKMCILDITFINFKFLLREYKIGLQLNTLTYVDNYKKYKKCLK